MNPVVDHPDCVLVAREVRRVCHELAMDLDAEQHEPADGDAIVRLVPGYFSTCYGVVRALARNDALTLVVGRLVTGEDGAQRVEVVKVRVEGTGVIALLAHARRELDQALASCTCGYPLPPDEAGYRGLDHVCPACGFRPFRPRDWRA